MSVKNGDTIKVHYTGKFNDGKIFDSSSNRDPLEVQVGAGELIPGFESELIGMKLNEKKSFIVTAEEAYGTYMNELVFEVEKTMFPPDLDPKVGQQLQMDQGDNQLILVNVLEVNNDKVKLDANHPLAGKDLHFDIQLVGISNN